MVHFALLIHAHQPLGNFDNVIEEAYRLAYLPFVRLLERHPRISLALHYSGTLLQWIEKQHPDYFELLRKLVKGGQVEMLGGGFYEPILVSIPERDRHAQLVKMSDYLASHFGARPRGIWLTERIWEPSLAYSLAEAGIEYTLTDDTHFLNAGLELVDLCGYYMTESSGAAVRVIPGLKDLRYTIPFRDVQETVDYLRRAALLRPEGLIAMGDDLEKFGVWPETHQHCYDNGWLENFFAGLEAESSWLKTVRASDYLDAHPALGRIYLPTASYHEMMEWALPSRAGEAFERVRHRIKEMPEAEEMSRFLRGGIWNNFFHKYSEANLLHKRMLAGSKSMNSHGEAYDHLLAGQCNDAYWHGIFGGLYAPHLRHAVYSSLIRAGLPKPGIGDLDLDGRPEWALASNSLFVLLDPGDGATVAEIDFSPCAVNVVNSLMRRPENYHKKLTQPAAAGAGAKSIHDRVKAKEEGLERELVYDRYERSCFRAYLFSAQKAFQDFVKLTLEEDTDLASGPYSFDSKAPVFTRGRLSKKFALEGNRFVCRVVLTPNPQPLTPSFLGMELIFNLMASNAPDRYFRCGDFQAPLRWSGELDSSGELWLKDEWLRVGIRIAVEPAARWWIAPIHTVSQSEDGFEKIYQGSMIMPWWPLTDTPFEAEVGVEIVKL